MNTARRRLDFGQPQIMGILNRTPDSFSDGGRFVALDDALCRALQLVEAGAAIVDVGGESSRPGAVAVSEAEELDRVVPLIERLADASDCVISVDTVKPVVMRAAIAAGASWVNDVSALEASGAIGVVVETGVTAVLMHRRGKPRDMQRAPQYGDVVADVAAYLRGRVQVCIAAGISADRLIVDPGFGFGKTLEHNLRLLANLDVFTALGLPVLIGVSRKSMFGQLLGLPVEQRLAAGIAAAVLAVKAGVSIIRSHDVRETVQALRVAVAVREAGGANPAELSTPFWSSLTDALELRQ